MDRIPYCYALVICDAIIEEVDTHKKSLINIFNDLWAAKYPCLQKSLGVYISMSDASGSYEIVLELVNASSSDESVYRTPAQTVEIADPLQNVELVFTLNGLVFPSPGKYVFRLLANDKLICQRPMNAVLLNT
jgi:hypothetical protein